MMSDVPQREEMYNPLLQALRDLGGAGVNEEIADRVIKTLNVPEEVASVLHSTDNSNETELEYRLAWARTYLKNFGMLERSGRGVWAIKADKQTIERVDPTEVNRFTQAMLRASHTDFQGKDGETDATIEVQDPESPDAALRHTWHPVLTAVLEPAALERLVIRLL